MIDKVLKDMALWDLEQTILANARAPLNSEQELDTADTVVNALARCTSLGLHAFTADTISRAYQQFDREMIAHE